MIAVGSSAQDRLTATPDTASQFALSLSEDNGHTPAVGAPVGSAGTLVAQRLTATAIPRASADAVDALVPGTPDLSRIAYHVLPSWRDAARIQPPLSEEAVSALSRLDVVGLAFRDGGRDYAVVSLERAQQEAPRFNTTPEAVVAWISAQEVAQSYHRQASGIDGVLSPAQAQENELFGEAAAARVNPDLAFLAAMSWLGGSRETINPNYIGYLRIAAQSMNETLKEAGFGKVDGKEPADALILTFAEAWRSPANRGRPVATIIEESIEAFAKAHAPEGVDRAALRRDLQANYVAALTKAAEKVFD